MATRLESRRIVIAGASSLLGAELKELLEGSRFATSDFRLVDEAAVAGILTEAGGEAAVIQPVEEDSFNKAWIVFFTGSPAFTRRNYSLAKRSGGRIVDLSGEFAGQGEAETWLAKPEDPTASAFRRDAAVFAVPSAPAEIIALLALALRSLECSSLTAVAFQPVSAGAGRAGIEELESQTGQLLSFQPLSKEIFDAQVAFTMLDRFGPASNQNLQASVEVLRREVRACLPGNLGAPAVQLLHAPVYYGTVVTACASLDAMLEASAIAKACVAAGFRIADEEAAPSNASSTGESTLLLAQPQADPARAGTWWFWSAADNLRLPAANAVKLAEKLLE